MKFSDCVKYVNQATNMLNLQNIPVKNSNDIKPIANYSVKSDSITVNLQKISKIPNHTQYVMYEEAVHAYEARINAKYGFFPYLLQFDSPHRDMYLEYYFSEIVQAFMDYIACKHVVSLGITFDEPFFDEESIQKHKSDILASLVFNKISKFAHNKSSKTLAEKYVDIGLDVHAASIMYSRFCFLE